MKCKPMVFCWFLLVAGALGHHGPEEVVAELTALLELRPGDGELRSRRATAYRVLGMHAEAEADLRRVLLMDPRSGAETEALARVLWEQGKQAQALRAVRGAVGLAPPGRPRGAVLVLMAEWHLERGDNVMAMDACREAFEEDPKGMVDWYLLRGRIHARVGGAGAAVAGLKAGQKALGSVVLRDAWVDASLDAGMFSEVAPVIDAELARSRLKSSWLIRRGRLRLGTGADDAARRDLQAAIEELNRRIHPERPDAQLLVDRGWAWILLGNGEAARTDLAQASVHEADPWEVAMLAAKIGE